MTGKDEKKAALAARKKRFIILAACGCAAAAAAGILYRAHLRKVSLEAGRSESATEAREFAGTRARELADAVQERGKEDGTGEGR